MFAQYRQMSYICIFRKTTIGVDWIDGKPRWYVSMRSLDG